MSAIVLVEKAKSILYQEIPDKILYSEIKEDTTRLKLIIKGAMILYIRYNNHKQYSYVIQFSKNKYDRIRYDNFDEKWDVNSKPHHLHPRDKKNAIESPMIGDPNYDINLLIDFIKKNYY